MTFISETGNLAETPILRKGDFGAFATAHILVTERIKTATGYTDGATARYQVTINGSAATNLVDVAQASGNISVHFQGELHREAWEAGEKSGVNNIVRNAEIHVSLSGQQVRTKRGTAHLEPQAYKPPKPETTN